jgi:gliding motility-associated-like protein
VEVDVTVTDFVKIAAMQYSHNFDSLVLDYVDIINKSSNLPGLSHLGPEGATVDNGQIVVTWNDPFGENVTLTDDERVYTIRFVAIGGECDSSFVSITSDPRRIEVLDENFDDIGLNTVNGLSKIPGTDCAGGGGGGDITIRANSASGDNGTEVCLQIRVDNFEEVESMQFSMSWDPAIITYSRVTNFNLQGLGNGNFSNIAPGSLRCIWDPQTGGNITVPNNTRIFDLCFNVVGSNGQMSDVDFVNTPLPIEFNTTSGVATHKTNSGKVTVTGGGGGGDAVELNLGSATGNCDEVICIPLTVKNFTKVEAMQFSINFPPDLEFVEARNFMLPGLSAASIFNSVAGVLRVVWDDPGGASQTLADDSKIVELCFRSATGDKMYDIEVTDTPLKIEVQQETGTADVESTAGKITINPCGMTGDLKVVLKDTFHNKCNGLCKGFIEVTASGGSGSYSYMWFKEGVLDPALTGFQAFNLCAGVYSVKVTDVADTTMMVTLTDIIIREPDPMVATANITPVTSGCNGEISYTVTGGTPPYLFIWSTGLRDSIATGLCKGQYNVSIVDAENCSLFPDTVDLSGPPLDIGTPNVISPNCYGDCNGSITIDPTGGCGDYTFNWSGMNVVTDAKNQAGLCAGNYNVTVTDTMGGTATLTITVNQPDSIKIALDSIVNGAVGSIFVTLSGGNGSYTVKWTDEDDVLVGQSRNLTGVSPGTYTIMVTDDKGCVKMRSFTVSLSDLTLSADVSTYANGDNVACNGGSDGSITVIVEGGSGNYTYSWDHDPAASGPTQTDLPAGTYKITVMDMLDMSTKVITVTLTEPTPLTATVAKKNCADGLGQPSGSYEVIPAGGAGGYSYLWCNNNTSRVPLNLPGGSSCNVLVTDINGCQIFMDDIQICYDTMGGPVDECFIGRDVITPNGDAYNEFFIITCTQDSRYSDNELLIFNRWGQLVNSYSNYSNQWNGVDDGGNEMEEDTYMWVFKVILPNGAREVYRGAVTVLRN